jgi:O-antigen ligase
MADHVASIVGIGSNDAEGAARGSEQRVGWWKDIAHRWIATPTTFMFGLGYGFPLIDLKTTDGVPVREPHNSIVSIAGRLGFIGLVSWLWMQALLLLHWRRALRYCSWLGLHREVKFLKITMIFTIIVIVGGMTEPSFELSFLTIPYYFLWGLVLALEADARKQMRAAINSVNSIIDTSAPEFIAEPLQPA